MSLTLRFTARNLNPLNADVPLTPANCSFDSCHRLSSGVTLLTTSSTMPEPTTMAATIARRAARVVCVAASATSGAIRTRDQHCKEHLDGIDLRHERVEPAERAGQQDGPCDCRRAP